jgi:hypothetical protein
MKLFAIKPDMLFNQGSLQNAQASRNPLSDNGGPHVERFTSRNTGAGFHTACYS